MIYFLRPHFYHTKASLTARTLSTQREGIILSMRITHWTEWVTTLGFLLSLAVLAFSGLRYVQIEEVKQKQQTFSNYHSLIQNFGGGNKDSVTAAVVFELRNYPEYCELSTRLLRHFQGEWKEGVAMQEMENTLAYLKPICSGA